jgi:hypothetical protein
MIKRQPWSHSSCHALRPPCANYHRLLGLCFLKFPRSFKIGYDLQLFGVVPVFLAVLQDCCAVRQAPLLSLLESKEDAVIEAFVALEISVTALVQEIQSEKAMAFDLSFGQRVVSFCVSVLESWLANYHVADAGVVVRVMTVLSSSLRCLRVLSLLTQAKLSLASPAPHHSMSSPKLSAHDAHASVHALIKSQDSVHQVCFFCK